MKDARSLEELRSDFTEKNNVLLERGYALTDPISFYRDMFPRGLLATSKPSNGRNSGKPNAIATRLRPDQLVKQLTEEGSQLPMYGYDWAMYDNLTELMHIMNDPFGAVAPVTYFGRRRWNSRAHGLQAVGVDIDGMKAQNVKNLLKQIRNGYVIMPTYIINSGRGLHLYYFLDEPVELYHNRQKIIGQLRHNFARRFWTDSITTEYEKEPEDQSNICQVFRCPGGQTKLGADYIVQAYKISDNRYTLEDLYVYGGSFMSEVYYRGIFNKEPRENFYSPMDSTKRKYGKPTTPLPIASKKWPIWYRNRIILKIPVEKTQDEGRKKCFKFNPAMYEWYKREIVYKRVKAGARYWAVMFLCNFALKCGITKKQVKHDALDMLPYLDSLTEEETNHFTFYDLEAAINCMYRHQDTKLIKTSTAFMERKLRLQFPKPAHPHREKGKRLKREKHLQIMNSNREIRYQGDDWRYHGGAPKKQQKILEWRKKHPNGTKKECELDTHLSKHTIIKWWGEPPRKYEYGLQLKGQTLEEVTRLTQEGKMLTIWEEEKKEAAAAARKAAAAAKAAEKKRDKKAMKNKSQKTLFTA